jgi:hypothetical protein
MRLAIMQPYFFPYIGYFQLIAAVDLFIVYDNIKYTKKGWISRNRMLLNGKDVTFSLSLKRDSDHLDICERSLAADFDRDKLLEQIIRHEDANLFRFLHYSIAKTCEHLGITTEIRISSDIAIDHGLKGQDRVLAVCKTVGARIYVNAIGGTELYSKDKFRENGLELRFIKSSPFEYTQFGESFVPWLSIVDVMMFNPLDRIRASILTDYELM